MVRTLFDHLDDAEVSYLLRRHLTGTVVACLGPDIVGYYQIHARGEPGVAWLNFFGVMPPWRGQGAAQALLARCERHAKTCGFESMKLDAFAHNHRAHRFYARQGYTRLGEWKLPDGVKFRFEKSLAQTPALDRPAPSLQPPTTATRWVRRVWYAVTTFCAAPNVLPNAPRRSSASQPEAMR
ncbi:MAG: GNAT family N-acetyltransferase [Burkholderiaceae bacterium]